MHFATCPDFGREVGECKGCAPRPAREGVVLCERCYFRLRSALEDLPDLVGMLRAQVDPRRAADYARMAQRSGSRGPDAPPPVSVDLLDAIHDLMHGAGIRHIDPGQESDDAYALTLDAVGGILGNLDWYVSEDELALHSWAFACGISGEDEPWTIARALRRWPLEERGRYAPQPCPECNTRTVKITPPRHRYARLWMTCEHCGWRKNELDDEGLWAAAFGYRYDEREEPDMAQRHITKVDIDPAEAFKAAVEFVDNNQELVAQIGRDAALLMGGLSALAEQFALVADAVAKDARQYVNGDLIAGGARMVARSIRDSAEAADVSAQITAAETTPAEAAA